MGAVDRAAAVPRVAVVTGASSGIGAAVARDLAAAGCHVVVNYRRNREGAEAVAADCREAGVEALTCAGDVADDADCRALAAVALDRWDRIDVLVNNAAVTRFADAGDLGALQATDFEHIFAVNVTACYQMAHATAAALTANRGAIVNVSSHSGFSGLGSSLAYAASKGALNTLTLGLARALAPEIRVNAVCPGFVDTAWMAPVLEADALAAFKRKAAQIAPLRRIVTPAEVAAAVRWFALGGAAITGQLLVIDAGTHPSVGDPIRVAASRRADPVFSGREP